uniref:Uncharacterized protein n=1 Tax=Arundo donax TaxID=35708 RepID=A0A0A8ZAP1_ARUDO
MGVECTVLASQNLDPWIMIFWKGSQDQTCCHH